MYMTPWVQRLLIANVVVHLLATPSIKYAFAFVPRLVFSQPWTVVTYMFLHADFMHVFFNMFMLFFFGPRLEQRLGGRGFLWLYFLSGIGGAALTFAFDRNVSMIGASGAVYGIVAGFAYLWPRERIYIWGVLPVEAWLLAMFAVGASLWSGITGGGNVAHFAHLGGLAFGYGYVRWKALQTQVRKKRWREGKDVGNSESRSTSWGAKREVAPNWKNIKTEGLHKLNRDEVDALLDRISADGVQSLTDEERAFLDRMADSV